MAVYMQAYDAAGAQTVYYVVDAFDDEPISTVPAAVGVLTRKRRVTSGKTSSGLPIASQTLLGRVSAEMGPVEALTVAQVRELLNIDANTQQLIDSSLLIPMVRGGFHNGVLTTTAQPKLPRFVCTTDGRVMMTRYTGN